MTAGSKDGKRFEKKLSDLEEIVARLESGDTTLEDSLSLFEKGTKLLKDLTGILEEAERKVQILTKDASGNLDIQHFAGEDEGEPEE
ncbi:MAG: exodeoxyribonuclease VII small subunit [bacterium]|nr:exodeoxyribonuclease VII small subunit [bacterium]MDT8395869.1 exodeoxyribonuclease VII small subunit [bacterium]